MTGTPTEKPAKSQPETVALILRPDPKGLDGLGRDPAYRLRRLLKVTLRRFGWRCVRIEPRPGTRCYATHGERECGQAAVKEAEVA